MEEQIHIGKIVAVHGLDGSLLLRHDLGKATSLQECPALFLELAPGSLIPYFLLEGQSRSDSETLFRLETVDTPEKARLLLRKSVWIPEPVFRNLAARHAPISLLGYQVYASRRHLGPVVEVIEQPHQILLRLEVEGKEVLLPLHADTLRRADAQKKRLDMILPEGLLEIYLG
ncbi:MAG: 16S rRNA processing protein RimM [Bacteroidetes bacterium]|nr:16S rRNA processing protein RimM [Bacteroidota bacterium]